MEASGNSVQIMFSESGNGKRGHNEGVYFNKVINLDFLKNILFLKNQIRQEKLTVGS